MMKRIISVLLSLMAFIFMAKADDQLSMKYTGDGVIHITSLEQFFFVFEPITVYYEYHPNDFDILQENANFEVDDWIEALLSLELINHFVYSGNKDINVTSFFPAGITPNEEHIAFLAPFDGSKRTDNAKYLKFVYTNNATEISEMDINATMPKKFIKNMSLYINHNGKTYNIIGK